MSTYSIAEAKDHLSRLVDEVLAGSEVTITRHGKPVAELRPAVAVSAGKRMTAEDLEWLRKRRAELPTLVVGDAVTLVREMREDF